MYVLTRFDNAIKIINTNTKMEIGQAKMFNPEPKHIVNGRRFLYDASFSSSKGDSACFSCHIFGDMDHLAWNLGDPDQADVNDPPMSRVLGRIHGYSARTYVLQQHGSARGPQRMSGVYPEDWSKFGLRETATG